MFRRSRPLQNGFHKIICGPLSCTKSICQVPVQTLTHSNFGAAITVLLHTLPCLPLSTRSDSLEPVENLSLLHSYMGTMVSDVSMIALENPNHMGAILEKDDYVNGKQSQQLMKFELVSKLPRSPPTLSTFSCLTSDSDSVLIERLHSHCKRLDIYSKRSVILRFFLMRRLTLGFTTYQIPVCHILLVIGLHIFIPG